MVAGGGQPIAAQTAMGGLGTVDALGARTDYRTRSLSVRSPLASK